MLQIERQILNLKLKLKTPTIHLILEILQKESFIDYNINPVLTVIYFLSLNFLQQYFHEIVLLLTVIIIFEYSSQPE